MAGRFSLQLGARDSKSGLGQQFVGVRHHLDLLVLVLLVGVNFLDGGCRRGSRCRCLRGWRDDLIPLRLDRSIMGREVVIPDRGFRAGGSWRCLRQRRHRQAVGAPVPTEEENGPFGEEIADGHFEVDGEVAERPVDGGEEVCAWTGG